MTIVKLSRGWKDTSSLLAFLPPAHQTIASLNQMHVIPMVHHSFPFFLSICEMTIINTYLVSLRPKACTRMLTRPIRLPDPHHSLSLRQRPGNIKLITILRLDSSSLSESVMDFPRQFGRTYHAYKEGCKMKLTLNNDDATWPIKLTYLQHTLSQMMK